MSIILASASPRRSELLRQIGITDFKIIPAKGEEDKSGRLQPGRLVENLSMAKAREVAAQCADEDFVIAADTVVAISDEVLGKPADEEQAAEMLRLLSGRTHQVYTGVTVIHNGHELVCHEETNVFFRKLTEGEIQAYIATGEPMDKAGSYGIQGIGARFIYRIEGDYTNVVGLPLCRLCNMLDDAAHWEKRESL